MSKTEVAKKKLNVMADEIQGIVRKFDPLEQRQEQLTAKQRELENERNVVLAEYLILKKAVLENAAAAGISADEIDRLSNQVHPRGFLDILLRNLS